jgi:hypothetical protein
MRWCALSEIRWPQASSLEDSLLEWTSFVMGQKNRLWYWFSRDIFTEKGKMVAYFLSGCFYLPPHTSFIIRMYSSIIVCEQSYMMERLLNLQRS